MRYRADRTRFKWNPKSEINSLVKIADTVLRDQSAYQNSLTDQMTPQSIPRPFNGLDPTNPAHTMAGSDHPIISKNQSRSNCGHMVVISRPVIWRSCSRESQEMGNFGTGREMKGNGMGRDTENINLPKFPVFFFFASSRPIRIVSCKPWNHGTFLQFSKVQV